MIIQEHRPNIKKSRSTPGGQKSLNYRRGMATRLNYFTEEEVHLCIGVF